MWRNKITAAMVKELRERTGAGMMECKKALVATNGDIDTAIEQMRISGLARADQKTGRITTEGVVAISVADNGSSASMVEINCETDFVAMNDQFKGLVHDISMQIAAARPQYVSREEIPEDAISREKKVQLARVMEEGKPEHIAEKIVDGRLRKFFEERTLLDQKYVKDYVAAFGGGNMESDGASNADIEETGEGKGGGEGEEQEKQRQREERPAPQKVTVF